MNEKYVIKANGERELFDPQKLKNSLERAGANEPTITKIVEHIDSEIGEKSTTKEIYRHAFELLGQEEGGLKPRAKYSLRRAIMELGPTGFPFEQFVAEIFRAKGFETTTDFFARGKCAEHEIDVTAWNQDKLIFIEAKFHNELGLKSDLKVALYVNSRWEDLKGELFEGFGKAKRKMDEGWLITNTKFSESAISYAKCRNMKLVGWNYPEVGNLQDLIEETRLHPITCLNSSTSSEERLLMQAGIVLCKQALDNPGVLRQVGLSEQKIEKMLAEIRSIQK